MIRNAENRELYKQGLKHCYKCDTIKSLSEFNKKKSTWDGLRSNCKLCDRNFHTSYRSNELNYQKEIEYKKQYRQSEHGKSVTSQYSKTWSDNNKDYKKIAKNRWHLRNKESENAKSRVRMRQWAKDNPEKHRTNNRRRRARVFMAEGSHTLEEWKMLLTFFDGKCPCCGTESHLTLDHIIPLNRGGTHYLDNIQPLCKTCNSTKQDRLIIDYRPQPARYWAWVEMSFVALY